MDKQIDIHIFDMDNKLFQELFPKEEKLIDEKDIGKIENRKKYFDIENDRESSYAFSPVIIEALRNKFTIIWNAFNYPKLLDNNYKAILKYFYKRINIEENRNNIVIKFSNSYLKDFSTIINKIKKNKPFLLYVLINDKNNKNEFKFFKFPQYISYVKYCNNEDNKEKKYKFVNIITSYIMEKQKYFFELNSTFQNLFSPNCFLECNILLIGESRAGKSSFINRVFNKLVSHEDANLESVTNNSTQYVYKKGKVGIKLVDTPGIIKNSNIKFIKQILDEYFGKIHLIFFFIKAQSNLENCIEILKYIKNKNEKNFKEGIKKIPLIFIKNGEDLEINNETPAFFKYLKGELKMNNILELYDDKFNQKTKESEKKINEIDEEELFNDNEEIENNYNNNCEGNIVQIHIPTGKNIDKVFWISKEYLIENNRYLMDEKEKEFFQIKEYTKRLIKFYIKKKIEMNKLNKEEKEEKKTLLKKCNDYIDIKKNECSLLYNLEILNIKKGNKLKKAIGIFTGIIIYPLLFVSIFFLPSFISLGLYQFVDIFFDEYILSLSIKYGFDDQDLIEYDLKKYLVEKVDDKEKTTDQKMDNIKTKEIQKIKNANEFFEKLLLYIGPIQCLIKAKELSKNLFDFLEELKNRNEKDWITYNIHEFNKVN